MTTPAGAAVAYALAYQTWADGADRGHSWSPDRMIERLSTDARVSDLVVADPARHVVSLVRTPTAPFPVGPHSSGRLVRPWRGGRGEPEDRSGAIRVARRVERLLRRRSRPDAVLVTSHPVVAAVADRAGWRDVTYYGWDDWAAYPPFARMRDLIEWSYAEMAARDVQVLGVTEAVVARIGAARSTVVPNGVERVDPTSLPAVPGWFADLRGSIAFYAGSLESRVDERVLGRLAADLPDWNVVLVGPMTRPEQFAPLRALPNVVVAPSHSRPEVLAMASHATVCLVPHRRTPMTEAMSPLKLYEYLAVGAPVVATDLPAIRGISDRCLLVDPGAPMMAAVMAAAVLGPAGPAAVAVFQKAHDWDVRYDLWSRAVLGDDC